MADLLDFRLGQKHLFCFYLAPQERDSVFNLLQFDLSVIDGQIELFIHKADRFYLQLPRGSFIFCKADKIIHVPDIMDGGCIVPDKLIEFIEIQVGEELTEQIADRYPSISEPVPDKTGQQFHYLTVMDMLFEYVL